MDPANVVIREQTSAPVVGLIQDCLIAAYEITRKRQVFENGRKKFKEYIVDKTIFMWVLEPFMKRKQIFERILDPINVEDHYRRCDKYGIPRYSGKSLISSVFPIDLYYITMKKIENKQNYILIPDIIIKEGILIKGVLGKTTLGSVGNSIVHHIYLNYDSEIFSDWISNLQILLTRWLRTYGFSISLEDLLAPDHTNNKIQNLLDDRIDSITNKIITSGNNISEIQINNLLNEIRSDVGKLGIKSYTKLKTNYTKLTESGARGKPLNTIQIIGSLGQQNLLNKRFGNTLASGTKSHPYFKPNEMHPIAHGFVFSNYIKGLTPPEKDFHAMASRESIVDSQQKTPDTGYLQRQFIKNTEDIITDDNFGAISNISNHIIQPNYGIDRLNEERMVKSRGKQFFANMDQFFFNLENA